MDKQNLTIKKKSAAKGKTTIQTPQNAVSERIQTQNMPDQTYKQYIKYLVATNTEYFQNKLNSHSNNKPNDIRLKIPCKTGSTIYRKDYLRKKLKYTNQGGTLHNMSVDCIKTYQHFQQDHDLKFDGKTMYQKEFKSPLHHEKRKSKKRFETHTEDLEVPRFLKTMNSNDFLNWGTQNSVPSMKPSYKSAVTHVPFSATSVYKTDYEGKTVTQTPIFLRFDSFPKSGNASMVLKSNYGSEFSDKKSGNVEKCCKPKYYEATLCKQFKGSTEYKREFIKTRKAQQEQTQPRTLQELQTLILDL